MVKRGRIAGSLFVRIQFSNGDRLGPGKIALLAAIERTGSIAQAARSMRMSYRRAWLLVDSTNRLFGRPVVTAATGGRAGGGAGLTPFGRRLLTRYQRLIAAAERAAAAHLRQFEAWSNDRP